MDNTPWGLWSAAGKEKKDVSVAQDILTATMDDNRRHIVSEHMKSKQHEDFGRKAWMQSDRNNNTWVTTCPKELSSLNAGYFSVVYQTYFGVRVTYLLGGNGRTTHPAEIWTKEEAESGDGVRRVRRELGKGDLARRGVDIPPQWY